MITQTFKMRNLEQHKFFISHDFCRLGPVKTKQNIFKSNPTGIKSVSNAFDKSRSVMVF